MEASLVGGAEDLGVEVEQSLRWKVRIMEEKERKEMRRARNLKSLRRPQAWGQEQANSEWGGPGGDSKQCLLAFHHATHIPRPSTQPGCQPFCLKHFSFDIFKTASERDNVGENWNRIRLPYPCVMVLVMLYTHLLWRVGSEHHQWWGPQSLILAASRRKLSWDRVLELGFPVRQPDSTCLWYAETQWLLQILCISELLTEPNQDFRSFVADACFQGYTHPWGFLPGWSRTSSVHCQVD